MSFVSGWAVVSSKPSDMGEITININPSEVANKCLRQINKTTENISFIINALKNVDTDQYPPLQLDGLPITINAPLTDGLTPKERATEWVYKKAFEEFILGISESLIEGLKILDIQEYHKSYNSNKLTTEIQADIDKIINRPFGLNLPQLIERIEKHLSVELSLRNEILSINKTRNCIVHRNCNVTEKDINLPQTNQLRLTYLELYILAEIDGVMTELTLDKKKQGFETNKMTFQTRQKEKFFNIGDHIKIDHNTFNCISYTCIQFVSALRTFMPPGTPT